MDKIKLGNVVVASFCDNLNRNFADGSLLKATSPGRYSYLIGSNEVQNGELTDVELKLNLENFTESMERLVKSQDINIAIVSGEVAICMLRHEEVMKRIDGRYAIPVAVRTGHNIRYACSHFMWLQSLLDWKIKAETNNLSLLPQAQ